MDTEVFKLNLDAKEFIESIKSSSEALEKLGAKSEGLESLVKGIGSATALLGTLAVAIMVVKTSIDWIEEAEKIKQVENQFAMLSDQAGISGTKLKEGMLAAAKGTISETELLKLSNKAMIELGDNAVKIPQIMELARKAASVFGGSAADTFEQINQAIASGNTRMLKHIGIKIDAVKAERDYASSIGITVDALSQSGKQAAIMQAVLAEGANKFKNVNADALETKTTMEQFKTSVSEIGEAFILAFDKKAGPAVKFFAAGLRNAADWIKGTFVKTPVEEVNSEILKSQEHIFQLRNRMDELNKGGTIADKIFGNVEKSKETIAAQIAAIEAGLHKMHEQQTALTPVAGNKEVVKESGSIANKVDLDKKLAQETAFNKDLEKLNNERLKGDELSENSIEKVTENIASRKMQITADFAQKESEINLKLNQDKITQNQADALYTQELEIRDQKLTQMDLDHTERKIASLDRLARASQSTSQQFSAGFQQETLKAGSSMNNFSSVGKSSFAALGTHATAAFTAMGNGSKTAGQAMSAFVIGSIGSMASAAGQFYLMKGLAKTYDLDPTGPSEIAAGGALIALGGLLGAIGGASSGISGGGGGSSGGSGGSAATTAPSAVPAIGSGAPQKSVTVQIMGHIFETDETKKRLMEMIRQETDASSFAYKQVGV